tara:strand:- start:8839 stop:9963 length:1125 start_codon:yes stop_codon:yes gene_type:complete
MVYKKKNSFINLTGEKNAPVKLILNKIEKLDISNSKQFNDKQKKIFLKIKDELLFKTNNEFNLTNNIIDELNITDLDDWPNYLIHRYRYEVYPDKKILDEYPPYLQIEPSSICNYRCVFCFETDKSFTTKKNGYMGTMKIDLFKDIIDKAKGNIEFISLASRGEPLVNPEFEEMIKYTDGKFLNLKINTNASLLNESKCHAILSSGVKTLVFSADAADEKLYSKLRVNGKLKIVLKNIELFNSIKEKDYKKKKIITRVSGVKYSDEQNFQEMEKFWKSLVNQVAFVEYNPWENIYIQKPNNINTSCSDLWRRMFIWWDGKVNPCDTDYKSTLQIKQYNGDLSETWLSENYQLIRNKHLNDKRQSLKPCRSCNVI